MWCFVFSILTMEKILTKVLGITKSLSSQYRQRSLNFAPNNIASLYCWQILAIKHLMNLDQTWINVVFASSWWDLTGSVDAARFFVASCYVAI